MAFPMFTKRRLFESLWERARDGHKAPSLRLIAGELKLSGEEEAGRLLEDMARDGAISIVRGGEYPWLTLRRRTYTGDLIPGVYLDPERELQRPLVPEEAEAAAAVVIIEQPAPPAPEPEYPRGASGTARKAPGAVSSGTATRTTGRAPQQPEPVAIATPPAPPTSKPRPPLPASHPAPHRLRVAPCTDRQINIRVPADMYEALSAAGDREGLMPGAIARRIFLEAFDAARCDTKRQHKVRAEMVRVAQADGMPLPDFVTMLIERGFASYCRDRLAEAAE